jgi:hypothetical protein
LLHVQTVVFNWELSTLLNTYTNYFSPWPGFGDRLGWRDGGHRNRHRT